MPARPRSPSGRRAAFRLRGVALAAAIAVMAGGASAQTPPPLEEMAGELLVAPYPFTFNVPLDQNENGEFEGDASASGLDLRTSPGKLELRLSDGTLAGAAVRANEVRNVDPATGRPRVAGATGPCTSGAEPDCWQTGEALDQNLQAHADLCAFSVGFWSVDRASCIFDFMVSQISVVTGNPGDPVNEPVVSAFLADVTVGNPIAAQSANFFVDGFSQIVVPLNTGPCDGLLADCATSDAGPGGIDEANLLFGFGGAIGINGRLTQEQKALLGCGEFYGRNCELEGIRVEHAEAGALLRSFVQGAADVTNGSFPQPGTVGAADLPAAVRGTAGSEVLLPGGRGPGDPGYDASQDGTATGLQHPFAGSGPDHTLGTPDDVPAEYQFFASEMAALSWNFMMVAVVLSERDDDDGDGFAELNGDEFEKQLPVRTDGCSLIRPGLCEVVLRFTAATAVEKEDDPSGLPLLRWIWETGAEFSIDQATDNLAAFLGGRLHAGGPGRSLLQEFDPTGLGFLATLPAGATVPNSPFVLRSAGLDGEVATADDPAVGGAYGLAVACGNGEDDDGDGLYDVDDPGCPIALAEPENPQCDDGIDNDNDGKTDFDDPQCTPLRVDREHRPACGLGVELVAILPPLMWLGRRWKRRRP